MKRFAPSLLALLLPWVAAPLQADDTERIAALVEAGGVVTIPPGDYHLEGAAPVKLVSNSTITAYGARFHLPKVLGDKARVVVFAGQDIHHLTWLGGEFIGHVFDPAQKDNTWEPSVNTKGIEITTSEGGATHDILFRDVKSNGVAGAVIGVHGLSKKGKEGEVITPAQRVAVESCTLLRSGKFMWDYGYLWQILTWPEAYEPWEVERARKYFRVDKLRPVISIESGDDRVFFANQSDPWPVSASAEPKEALTFLGLHFPSNLVRGRQYFIVESTPEFIKIAETPGGPPIRFEGGADGELIMAHNISATYLAAYAPTGSGPGKGAFDITGAHDVRVTGCKLSALGDTMHIQACRNIVFANNHILGSRMGAFFLAEFCQNATVTGNLIDGTNGSRVMSVEKSCTDVTIVANTFRNGGRGNWINQPKNFILQGNVFVNNTTKNEPDLRRGRIAYQTGKPVSFPELYFTLYEEGASYGPVIVRDNVFSLGDSAPREAVTFAPNGHDIQMTGNVFQNRPASIVVDPSCQNVNVGANQGAETKIAPVDFNHGRR
ncbi:MAG: right-handed parallel beta-helix repeat-containing protein [Verrucomicrobiota bacterium]